MTTPVQLSTLITSQTPDQVLTSELTYAQQFGLPTTTWQSGSVIRTIFVIVANVISIFSQMILAPIQGGFGDLLSSLQWGKLWAQQMYNVQHIDAYASVGLITATNTANVAYPLDAGDLIIAHSVTGALYRNNSAIVIPANGTLTGIQVTSVAIGTANDAGPNLATVLVGPSMNGVTVTNPNPILGGDDETLPALISRSRSSLGAFSPNGPRDAYNYVAKTQTYSPTGSPITRSYTFANAATGGVSVFIATATGAPIPADVAIVQSAINTWVEPWCTTATAIAASVVTINVTYQVYVKSAAAQADILSAISTAISAYFASVNIGGTIVPPAASGNLLLEGIRLAIAGAQVNGISINAQLVNITSPTSDTPLTLNSSIGQVAVLGTVTGTVTFL